MGITKKIFNQQNRFYFFKNGINMHLTNSSEIAVKFNQKSLFPSTQNFKWLKRYNPLKV